MSLEKQIQDQYKNRTHKAHLYDSEYSRLADREKVVCCQELLSEHLPNGVSVLEIGAGQGHNVALLRKCGFEDIVLNELLPERVAHAKKNFPELKIHSGNAMSIDFGRTFDCVFQSTVFTSVLSDEERVKLAEKMWDLLNPGGVILWYDFVYNNPKNSDVRKVSVKEVKKLFPKSSRCDIRRVTLAPPIGRRVGKLYPLFNLPFLRSHILAVFHKD